MFCKKLGDLSCPRRNRLSAVSFESKYCAAHHLVFASAADRIFSSGWLQQKSKFWEAEHMPHVCYNVIMQSKHKENTLSMAFPTRDTLLWMSLWSEASFWTVSFILLQHWVITSEIVPDKSPSWSRQKRGKSPTLVQTNGNIKSLNMLQHKKTKSGIKEMQSREYLQSEFSLTEVQEFTCMKTLLWN